MAHRETNAAEPHRRSSHSRCVADRAARPRLRFAPDGRSDTWRGRHDGAAAFARGVYAAVRNPSAHEQGDEFFQVSLGPGAGPVLLREVRGVHQGRHHRTHRGVETA
ncbi:TIGR02391 family protein [Streptomyces sp. NPDC087228]|uniref:TIGR02391 family protein n=1 Tax=unclassified Streptomyces TaxID=2593676 RepID=UPI0033D7CA69